MVNRSLLIAAIVALVSLVTLALRYYRSSTSSSRRLRTNSPKSRSQGSNSSRSSSSGTPAASSSSRGGRRATKQPVDELRPEPNPDLPDLVVLMGIPGSGKSTWAEQYVFRCDAAAVIVSSDAIRKQLTGDINDQSRNVEVWEIVLNHVLNHLKSKKNVILDATNVETEKRRRFMNQIPIGLCNRIIKIFTINKSIARGRIQKDVAKNVCRATVPDQTLDKMDAQLHESLAAIKDERWIIKS